MSLTPHSDGVRLSVRLTPKASRNKIGGIEMSADGSRQIKVYVTAIPENGKANKALLKILSKSLKIPVGQISIASGDTNRNKQILIAGEVSELMPYLEKWLSDLG